MKLFKKFISYTALVLAVGLLLILFIPSRTPAIKGENSIAVLKKVKLGGINQYILMRGTDASNPVLLFLHGGPGYAQISYARKYQKQLEEDFVVVNWDQRGSGMSYSRKISKESMNRQQFIEDTRELIDYLCSTLGKDKVYLVGHSWGSELGMYVVDKYPEKIIAFISIGQVVDGTLGEVISYDYVMEKAEEDNNKRALKELTKIGRPPYKNLVTDTSTQRKWLGRYGGVEQKCNTLMDIIYGSLFSPEYTGIGGIRMAVGSRFTADIMWGNNSDLNFIELIPEVKVPIYFCAGRYDYNTPSVLIEKLYESIKAPRKELVWFEESAHFPCFEEVEKFSGLMKGIKENKN
jgi:pimeloyl-ACP methyl ester carboxylesterase